MCRISIGLNFIRMLATVRKRWFLLHDRLTLIRIFPGPAAPRTFTPEYLHSTLYLTVQLSTIQYVLMPVHCLVMIWSEMCLRDERRLSKSTIGNYDIVLLNRAAPRKCIGPAYLSPCPLRVGASPKTQPSRNNQMPPSKCL